MCLGESGPGQGRGGKGPHRSSWTLQAKRETPMGLGDGDTSHSLLGNQDEADPTALPRACLEDGCNDGLAEASR